VIILIAHPKTERAAGATTNLKLQRKRYKSFMLATSAIKK
jgi:hypothetical protein